jgi:hypothetical protein
MNDGPLKGLKNFAVTPTAASEVGWHFSSTCSLNRGSHFVNLNFHLFLSAAFFFTFRKASVILSCKLSVPGFWSSVSLKILLNISSTGVKQPKCFKFCMHVHIHNLKKLCLHPLCKVKNLFATNKRLEWLEIWCSSWHYERIFSMYLGSPLPVSFRQCSVFIHSPRFWYIILATDSLILSNKLKYYNY